MMEWLTESQTFWALTGGALVGLAAALLLVATGRAMAISGMFGSLLGGAEGQAAWSIAFIAGLIMAATVLALVLPAPVPAAGVPLPLLLAGGLMLGIGARLAPVGLIGDAVTGLARLSRRSAVAVVCMVISAGLAVLVTGMLAPAPEPAP